jgi:hypothetical protein
VLYNISEFLTRNHTMERLPSDAVAFCICIVYTTGLHIFTTQSCYQNVQYGMNIKYPGVCLMKSTAADDRETIVADPPTGRISGVRQKELPDLGAA